MCSSTALPVCGTFLLVMLICECAYNMQGIGAALHIFQYCILGTPSLPVPRPRLGGRSFLVCAEVIHATLVYKSTSTVSHNICSTSTNPSLEDKPNTRLRYYLWDVGVLAWYAYSKKEGAFRDLWHRCPYYSIHSCFGRDVGTFSNSGLKLRR